MQTLTTAIGLTGGSLLVSDDLPALPKDRLAIAQALLPVIGKRARVLDLFDTDFPSMLRVDLEGPEGPWHLLAKFNWEASPRDLTFTCEEYQLDANQSYWLREFWTGQIGLLRPDRQLTFAKIPAHGVAVVAARVFDPINRLIWAAACTSPKGWKSLTGRMVRRNYRSHLGWGG